MSEPAPARTSGLPRALLAYALALAVLLLIPPTLHGDVGPWPGFTWQEAVDLLTPLVVIPLAWSVLDRTGALHGPVVVVFVAIAALWADAHGIHLAANAIGDTLEPGTPRDAFYATGPGLLDHFLDEDLGHWLWHLAWCALSVLMLWLATRSAAPLPAGGAPAGPDRTVGRFGGVSVAAGVIHGLTFFLVTTEGGTAALGIPVSILLIGWAGRSIAAGSRHPIVQFFAASSVATLVADGVWAALNGGRLVEPCSLIHC
jgi:hypothetical protein